jgi:hypothetical protein
MAPKIIPRKLKIYVTENATARIPMTIVLLASSGSFLPNEDEASVGITGTGPPYIGWL